jgi:hypothetical protein
VSLLLSILLTPQQSDFWSFQRLRRPDPPAVRDERWARTPIDRFVLSKLEAKDLTPSPPADRRTLIRRAAFDLTGLPPTPEEVDAFVSDPDPAAYEKLIDRLLASPRHGERWARHWLDVARFAESHGFEHDYDRPHAYHYRDFVIRALNQDLPFDRFVRWQLAGDEEAPEEPLAMMATGFLGAGVFPTQLTEREFERARYDEMDDMLATTGTAFLGLTIGCARCHDHKFDPIGARDYYRMLAAFTSTIRSEVEVVLNRAEHDAQTAEWRKAQEPLVRARSDFESARLPARLTSWEATAPDIPEPGWEILDLREFTSAGGAEFKKREDGSLLIGGANPNFDTYTIVAATRQKKITAVRVEALADPSMVGGGPGRAANGNFCLTDLKITAASLDGAGEPADLRLTNAKATFEQKGLPVANVIDDQLRSGWAVDPQFGKNHAAVFEIEGDAGFESGTLLTFRLVHKCNTGHNIGRPRLSVTSASRPVPIELAGPPGPAFDALRTPAARRSPEQVAALLDWYKRRDPEWIRLDRDVREHLRQAPRPKTAVVMVCSEGVPPMKHHADDRGYPHSYPETYVLRRGDPTQKSGVAELGFLPVLTNGDGGWEAPGARTSMRRTALARWITDPQHGAGHLLARVIVNRLWQHHFGSGIVATPSDFGAQGARPTHPELLDWLACELIDRGWSLKHLHRLMMTSAAYRQGSASRGRESAADDQNLLLWRFAPRRLESESIRDAILSVSGLLDSTMLGPGTLDENSRRRSIYFTVKRSKLVPMMVTFDLPEPLVSIGRRAATTVTPQALFLMNGPQVRAAAEAMAKRTGEGPAADRIARAVRLALGRAPTPEELEEAVAFVRDQAAGYGAEFPALADYCQVLLGLNEFITLD